MLIDFVVYCQVNYCNPLIQEAVRRRAEIKKEAFISPYQGPAIHYKTPDGYGYTIKPQINRSPNKENDNGQR